MKNQKGITLITLTITIVVMMILTFTIAVNIEPYMNQKRRTNFETDMKRLKEEVDQYYARVKDIPIINKFTNTSMFDAVKNINDGDEYYVIDLKQLDIELNYGSDYYTIVNKEETEEITDLLDVYIINKQSHTIYYPKGIEFSNGIHYRMAEVYSEINIDETGPVNVTLEAGEVNNKIIKLTGKATDEETGIKTYQFYVNGELKTTVTTSDTSTTYNWTSTFGDYTAYIVVTDNVGNATTSETISFSDYTIATKEELETFRDSVNNGNTYEGKTITQTADIDLEGSETNQWEPIGNMTTESYFKGIFDANNCSINNIYINNSNNHQGLFSYMSYGTIKKIRNITGSITGNNHVGGIVGRISNEAKIINCHNSVTITGTESNIAGIVGLSEGGTVEKCSNNGQISGKHHVGGIVGYNVNATIKNCYNIGSIEGKSESNGSVGGIVGRNYTDSKVSNCYNIGSISCEVSYGGIAGYNDAVIENTFYLDTTASVGCYYDTSGNCSAESKSSDELKALTSTLGSEFEEDSDNVNEGYPILSWQ